MTKILVKFILLESKFHYLAGSFLKKKPTQTQENVFLNFFSEVTTESGLLGPKIPL